MLQSLYEVSGRTDLRLNALEKFIAAPPIGEENIFYREAVTSPLTEDRAWYEISRLRLLGGKQVAALAAARRVRRSGDVRGGRAGPPMTGRP